MNRFIICIIAIVLVRTAAVFSADAPAAGDLPAPWKQLDLGLAGVIAGPPPAGAQMATRPAVPNAGGSASEADGVFQVKGTMDLWGVADGCHFVYQSADGDVELIARVAAMDNPGGVAHAKASLLMRASLEAGSPAVTFAVTASDGTQFLHRDEANGKTIKIAVDEETQKKLVPKATFPIWLKLVRAGDQFTAYESADGVTWQMSGKLQLKLPGKIVAGIGVSSHKPDVLTKGTFDHVSVKTAAK